MPDPEDLPDVEDPPVHMWRLEVLSFGEGAVSRYRCELCLDELLCPPNEHPAEC